METERQPPSVAHSAPAVVCRPLNTAEYMAIDAVLASVYRHCRQGDFAPQVAAMPTSLLQWMADGPGISLRSAKRQLVGFAKAMHGPGQREDYRYNLDNAVAATFPSGRLCVFVPCAVYTARYGWSSDHYLCALQENGNWCMPSTGIITMFCNTFIPICT